MRVVAHGMPLRRGGAGVTRREAPCWRRFSVGVERLVWVQVKVLLAEAVSKFGRPRWVAKWHLATGVMSCVRLVAKWDTCHSPRFITPARGTRILLALETLVDF